MRALFVRDLLIAYRSGGASLLGIVFFLAVIASIPFAVGPQLELLARIGPAFLWIAALLATLLGLDRLFQPDREDGSLALLAMSDTPLGLLVLAKCLAHWLVSGLPLIIATPVFGFMLNMEPVAVLAVIATLAAGTPALTLIGAVAAAVTVSLPRGGLLIAVLVLPLAAPVLIFGISATYGAIEDPAPFLPPFMILCAITLLFSVIGPLAAAMVLRHNSE